jgi:predicted NBD/HSP70 family sugar kinase
MNEAVLAIDIGGSKIAFGSIVLNDGILTNQFLFSDEVSTPKGKDAIGNEVSKIITTCFKRIQDLAYQPHSCVGIGSPGRFIGVDQLILAPKSAVNLGISPDEFNGVNLNELFLSYLPSDMKIRLIVKNDAIAQFSGGLSSLLQNQYFRKLMLNQKIAYLGPGTGLGGGIAQVDPHGHFTFHTDGHLSNVRIEDEELGSVRAEDVCCGNAFLSWTGISTKDVNNNPKLIEEYTPQLKRIGRNLAKVMIQLYTGDIHIIVPDNGWSKNDIDFVKGLELFLIGGSLGTKGAISIIILKETQRYLNAHHYDNIQVFQIPKIENAALKGAAQFCL